MALLARDVRISRRSLLLAGLGIPLLNARAEALETLSLSFDGDNIHVGPPGLHFIRGKPLERLKAADTVVFLSQITVFSDSQGTVFRRVAERLVLSYAIWEQKYAVAIPGVSRSISGLTQDQAEAYCIDNMAVSALGLAPNKPFWLRFELRAATPKELSELVGDSGISLRGLVKFFGRKSTPDEPTWLGSAGPLRLTDLPRSLARRSRIG